MMKRDSGERARDNNAIFRERESERGRGVHVYIYRNILYVLEIEELGRMRGENTERNYVMVSKRRIEKER